MSERRLIKDVFWDAVFLVLAFLWCIPVLLFAGVCGIITLVKRFISWTINEIQILRNREEENLISEVNETKSIL